MSLTSVKMSEEVWLTCLTHALSTETEEIMGLLLGDIQVRVPYPNGFFKLLCSDIYTDGVEFKENCVSYLSKFLSHTIQSDDWICSCRNHWLHWIKVHLVNPLLILVDQQSKNGNVTALIWGALPQPRSDRQKDRVETNPEQLTAASVHAERMTVATGTTTRVIGWYHSHPHITVLPSHVDVRTQAMYQLLDSGFIGLIFSCFSEDAQKVGRIQVIAFQSLDGKQNHVIKPVSLSPVQKSSVIDIESSLSSSENTMAKFGSSKGDSMEQDTGDSGATAIASKGAGKSPRLGGFFANADAKTGSSYPANSLNNAIHDLDPMDMSEGMQEAMHLSNLEMSGAEYVRKEIPLQVVPTSSLLNLDSPWSSFTSLQRVLYEEERTAFNQAMAQNTRNGKVHPLSFIHHTSTYKASMCKMIEYCLSPAMTVLQDRLRENEIQLKLLAEEANVLESELARGTLSNSSPRSPSQGPRSSAPFGQRDLYPPNMSHLSRSRRGS